MSDIVTFTTEDGLSRDWYLVYARQFFPLVDEVASICEDRPIEIDVPTTHKIFDLVILYYETMMRYAERQLFNCEGFLHNIYSTKTEYYSRMCINFNFEKDLESKLSLEPQDMYQLIKVSLFLQCDPVWFWAVKLLANE